MILAVMSNNDLPTGKTTLATLLASTFSISQSRRASIFTTGDVREMLSMVRVKDNYQAIKSIGVFRAMLETATIDDNSVYDYAFKLPDAETYFFDLFSPDMSEEKKMEIISETMRKVTRDLVIVEINGDLNSALNKQVLEEAHVVFNVFNQSMKSMLLLKDYNESISDDLFQKSLAVCQKYDKDVSSEKEIAKILGIVQRNLIVMPYISMIGHDAIKGELDTLCRFIIKGNQVMLPMRQKLLELMQVLYDQPKRKVIREVREWHN